MEILDDMNHHASSLRQLSLVY